MNGFEEANIPGDVIAANEVGQDEYRDYADRDLMSFDNGSPVGPVVGKGDGNQWEAAVQQGRQKEQNAMMDQAAKDQQAAWDDYSGLVGKANQQAAQMQLSRQNDLGCLMSLAASNGGVVPQVAMERFNRKFGYDAGNGTGMFSGKYDDKGNFVVQMGTGKMDAHGSPILQDHVAGPMDQWIMMNRNKAAFSDDVRNMFRGFLSKSYSDIELDKAAGITRPVGSKTGSGGTIVPGAWLTGPQKRRGNISAFSADGRGNFSHTDYNEATGRYERSNPDQERPLSERERIEMMKEQGRMARANAREKGKMDVAELKAFLQSRGLDINEAKLKELIEHHQAQEGLQQQGINEKSAHNQVREDQQQQQIDETSAHHQQQEAQSAANEEGRNARSAAKGNGKGTSGESAPKPKYDKDLDSALSDDLKRLRARLNGKKIDDDGNEVDSGETLSEDEKKSIKKKISKIQRRIDENRGIGDDDDEVVKPMRITPAVLEKLKAEKARRDAKKAEEAKKGKK